MKAEVPVFSLHRGQSPLLVSIPHAGTYVPAWLLPSLTQEAQRLTDTDWHLDTLYNFLAELDITVLVATHSRYVIDLNRPQDDINLYPGQNTSGLCPVDTFDHLPIYMAGAEPDSLEMRRRIATYWQPYHMALDAELARLRTIHDHVVLWDAHSIRSRVSRFFEGELPHLNIGTADHQSCDAALGERLVDVIRSASSYSWVVNGRFKGGYITRHYGQPAAGVNALQLEMAMRCYMLETEPAQFDEILAAPARALLRAMLESILKW